MKNNKIGLQACKMSIENFKDDIKKHRRKIKLAYYIPRYAKTLGVTCEIIALVRREGYCISVPGLANFIFLLLQMYSLFWDPLIFFGLWSLLAT